MTLCCENYPKHVGDPCWKEAECRPDVVYPAFGGSGSILLTCDMVTAKCVEAVLPEITDWLVPCASDFTKKHLNSTSPYGADWDSTCSGGVCAYVVLPGEKCVNQGCTRRCIKDKDCPAGAVCQTMSGCPSPTTVPGYCKPGERDDFGGAGLTCL